MASGFGNVANAMGGAVAEGVNTGPDLETIQTEVGHICWLAAMGILFLLRLVAHSLLSD